MRKITKQNTFIVTLKADGSLFNVTPKGKRHTKPRCYTSYEISGLGMTLDEASQLARAKHGNSILIAPTEQDWEDARRISAL